MNTKDIQAELSTVISRGTDLVTGFGIRILVHVVSLITAGIVGATLPETTSTASSFTTCVLAYFGFICLIPRGIQASAAWAAPTGLGIFLCLLWTFLGVPWQFTIIWGGLLTWSIRLLAKKGKIGWDWVVFPFLLLCIYGFFSYLSPLTPVTLPLWTFPLLAIGGWGALTLHARISFGPIHRKMLASACQRLERQASALALPAPLLDPVKQLAAQGRDFNRLLPDMDTPAAELIQNIDVFTARLARRAGSPDSRSGETQSLAAEASRLNDRLSGRLREFEALSQSVGSALAARIEEFRQTALSLAAKKSTLPPDMRTKVDSIARTTDDILTCMRTDPRDVAPADRFLSRYLTAAHTVVDEYVRLSRQGGMHEAVAQALARSGDLLDRLEKAFVDEHGRLLQNDTLNFTAELNVLDTLLKMEGR